MTISTTTLVDDSFKVIVKADGVGSETEQILVNALELNNATSEPKISIANVYYEIEGDGNITLLFNENEEVLTINGNGNYGLKPGEPKIKATSTGNGNVLLTSDASVTGYNLVIECHKETGFTN
jgi:uncharacterized membrane protein